MKNFAFQYTKSQKLGQKFKGIWKYKSIDENGKPTGIGSAFEDLTEIKLKKAGHKVEQVPDFKNGPDLIIDGKPCQLKCTKYSHSTAKSFYKETDGQCSYKDQTAVVPKSQGKYTYFLTNKLSRKGLGKPKKVVESPVSRQDSIDYLKRGKKSFMSDLTNMDLASASIPFGAAVAVVGGAIDLSKNWDELDTKGKLKKVGKWLLIGGAVTLVSHVGECSRRQFLRPQ